METMYPVVVTTIIGFNVYVDYKISWQKKTSNSFNYMYTYVPSKTNIAGSSVILEDIRYLASCWCAFELHPPGLTLYAGIRYCVVQNQS